MSLGPARRYVAAFSAAALLASSAATAAPASLASVDPLVAVSMFGTSSSQAAICAAGAASAAATSAATAVQGQGNCLLPVVDAPAPVAATQSPPAYVPAGSAAIAGGGGIGVLPLLLGLAAIAGGFAWILSGDDEDSIEVPTSPS